MHNQGAASSAGQRVRLIVVRCSDAERDAIRRRARDLGLSVSRLLRDAALGLVAESRGAEDRLAQKGGER